MPLHDLVIEGNDVERIRELLDAGEDPNFRNYKGDTPLHIVAFQFEPNGHETEKGLQVARELITHGAEVNISNFERRTPLIQAVRSRKFRMVELLLEAGANVNLRDDTGFTAIHYTAVVLSDSSQIKDNISPELRILEALLRFNPRVDVKNYMQETPLIIAVKCKQLPIVQCLLKHNASVKVVDWKKDSVLHHAFRNNVNIEIVFELVRHGVEFGLINNKGQTPIDIYISNLNKATSNKLENAKILFKIFILLNNTLSSSQQKNIEIISREKNCQLFQFVGYCMDETKKILHDKLAPNHYVHNMALRGFFRSSDHVPFDVSEKVIDTLIKGQYPVYCDLIIAGICSPYLNKKFAELCCLVGNGEFLKYEVLYKLSFYLSYFDLLNMMVACCTDNEGNLTFPYLEYCYPIQIDF